MDMSMQDLSSYFEQQAVEKDEEKQNADLSVIKVAPPVIRLHSASDLFFEKLNGLIRLNYSRLFS